ncbi:MAG: DUF4185 domain-containing protein [Verrucomicrobia bacterium]|nr:DUF4185 domain-containing protein [Verrucomicrobiota bacterium]
MKISILPLLIAALIAAAIRADAAAASDIGYVTGSSQKIQQFIGDKDFQTGLPTLSLTKSNYNLANTDLGVAFYHKGRTFVMFGDSDFPGTADAMGYTTDTDPESGLTLSFYNTGNFSPILIPGILHGAFNVPIYGVSSAGKMYLYYSTDADAGGPMMGRTVVAVSTNDGVSFSAPLYTLATNYFINVSVLKVNCADWPGLPTNSGNGLLIFGSGPYRQSDLFLAFQPEADIATTNTIRYFAGLSNNSPTWSALDTDTKRITAVAFTNGSGGVEGVGEMSATFNVFLKKWLLFYNLSGKIQFREADQPWGPYSAKVVSFDPTADNGYTNFIYLAGANDTNLCDPNVTGHDTNTTGGVYGPYIFNQFSAGSADETNLTTTLYHSMSTWNPYNSVLMRTKLSRRVPPVIYAGGRATNFVTTAMPGGADAFGQSGTNADTNFGTNNNVAIKNNGTNLASATRKAWLRFPLNLPSTQRITSASLDLAVNGNGNGNISFTYNLHGLRFTATNQNWAETNLTWNNAPGNNTNDGLELDPAQTIFLGSFTTTTNRFSGQLHSVSSVMLKDFLNQSGGGPVTLILTRLTIDNNVENFATRENTNWPAPALSYVTVPKIPDASTTLNRAAGPLAFTVDSAATNASNLTVTAACSNTNLVPLTNIVLAGSGSNRTVTLTPASNQTGAATITLTVSDGLATTDANSFTLTVTTNHPPTLGAVSNFVLNAGVTLALTNTATDPDVPPQLLTFSLLTLSTGAVLNASNRPVPTTR